MGQLPIEQLHDGLGRRHARVTARDRSGDEYGLDLCGMDEV